MPYVPDVLAREAKSVSLPSSWVQIKPVVFGSATATFTGIPAMPGIYRLVCLPMKMAYVGQTIDLANRCLEHQLHLRKKTHTNPRLQGAYNRFGPKAFCFQVLEIWTSRWTPDCLSPAEQRWMNAHGKKTLFNVRPAGSDAWLEATGQVIVEPRTKSDGKAIFGPKAKSGGKLNSTSEDAGPTKGGDNRPLGRGHSVGTQTSKDWRNRMPGKKRRD